ncbi:SARP family transcriptional regulator [Protofrankia sp. BMG5.30]|uniref:SARP family transcriptional regulator n=2 Tax=Frankiaceae TaxID=74712 RepID=A0ABR5F094_9ACTN|nr:SARP family transcriptional regulator [Protofrankia coriariae]ONH35235.1 SARP family transcriptional regulator [Protofrankia sp. BMG5.30]
MESYASQMSTEVRGLRGERTRFRVLGPLEVYGSDDTLIDIHQHKPRMLLSLLLLNAGTWVSIDRICAVLWEDEPPRSSFGNIKTYVSQLRRTLPPAPPTDNRIESRAGAYRINLAPGELDVSVFDKMAYRGQEALREGAGEIAVEYFQKALELWRGQPFDELPESITLAEAARLEEQHWAVLEDLIDVRLSRGHQDAVLPTLRALTIEYPLRERLWGQLLLALHQSGRRAEALSAYQTVYRLLAEELGVEPGAGLRRLHQRILDADLSVETER